MYALMHVYFQHTINHQCQNHVINPPTLNIKCFNIHINCIKNTHVILLFKLKTLVLNGDIFHWVFPFFLSYM